MKRLFLFFFAALLLFLGVACDRHPASQTIPGYEQNQHQLNGQQALTPSEHPMKLLSEKKTASVNGD
ncbi:MAG: hypothetical protein FJ390_00435 [Verrucomicrobia bacterium]|nr:hypothetical protein [Verrucomicrobiota bacterium]